jgi:hypothetical protein
LNSSDRADAPDLILQLAQDKLTRAQRLELAKQDARGSYKVDEGSGGAPFWIVYCGVRQRAVNTLTCQRVCANPMWASGPRDEVRAHCPVWKAWQDHTLRPHTPIPQEEIKMTTNKPKKKSQMLTEDMPAHGINQEQFEESLGADDDASHLLQEADKKPQEQDKLTALRRVRRGNGARISR